MNSGMMHDHAAPIARNLELKVEAGADALTAIRTVLTDQETDPVGVQDQEDIYFTAPEGRLKLRTIRSDDAERRSELVAYQRGDIDGSRWSSYRILPMAADQGALLITMLELVMPVWVRVRKRREIFLIGATRIHLDTVDGLGEFVELETVISDQSQADAEREHHEVIAMLRLRRFPAVAGSYSALLADK